MATPVLPESAVDVAITYSVVTHSLGATVSNPLELMTDLGATLPVPSALELTFHVTEVAGFPVPETVALN